VTHSPGYRPGDVIPVPPEELQSLLQRRGGTKVIGVLGDPNSGKSVFLHLLNDELRRRGFTTLTQEADVTAPTQHWSLYAPEVRRELKRHMEPEERLRWIVESLRGARESGAVDFVLADLGGGRPDLGQRVTRENLAILQYVDGVVLVSRNDEDQIRRWLEELSALKPDVKVYAVLESSLTKPPEFDLAEGVGVAHKLDRALYAQGAITEGTRKVVEGVAERVVKDVHETPGAFLDKIVRRQESRERVELRA